eukprot:5906411-Pleurochrysis_carterae.AAC.1
MGGRISSAISSQFVCSASTFATFYFQRSSSSSKARMPKRRSYARRMPADLLLPIGLLLSSLAASRAQESPCMRPSSVCTVSPSPAGARARGARRVRASALVLVASVLVLVVVAGGLHVAGDRVEGEPVGEEGEQAGVECNGRREEREHAEL